MPIAPQNLLGRRASLGAVAVNGTQVFDPYGYKNVLAISGLSVYPFGVGDYASCQFTCTNKATDLGGAGGSLRGAYPLFNTRVFFGGVVLDGSGIVQLTFASKYVTIQGSLPQPVAGTLAPGDAVYVTLDAQQPATSALSGQPVTVVVGDVQAFSGAAVGAPFSPPAPVLQQQVTVAGSTTGTGGTPGGSGGGSNLPPGNGAGAFKLSTGTIAALAVGGVVVVGAIVYSASARGERRMRYSRALMPSGFSVDPYTGRRIIDY